MKQFFTLLLLILVAIACTRKSSTLNAGEVALAQSYTSIFGMNDDEITSSGEVIDGSDTDSNAIDTSLQISNYVRCIFQENSTAVSNGVIWFATYGNGVGRYNPKAKKETGENIFSFFSRNGGLSGNEVRDIQADHKGNIWIATNGGVSSYEASNENANSFQHITTKQGLISNNVWSILVDRDGIIWFGTDSGVCRYNPSLPPGSITEMFTAFPLPAANLTDFSSAYPAPKLINKIFQDKNGIIWFGANGNGVYSINPSSFSAKNDQPVLTHFTEKNGLCNNFIHGIYQDRKGDIWFSSRFGGVSRYSEEATGKSKFLNLTTKNGLSSNFVWNVFEDRKGNLWFATAGEGVDFLDLSASQSLGKQSTARGKIPFTNYALSNGLASEYVQSIMEDNKGNIWFGTANGVSRYVPDFKPVASWILFTSYPSKRDGC